MVNSLVRLSLSKFRENEAFVAGDDPIWSDPSKVANAIVMEINHMAG